MTPMKPFTVASLCSAAISSSYRCLTTSISACASFASFVIVVSSDSCDLRLECAESVMRHTSHLRARLSMGTFTIASVDESEAVPEATTLLRLRSMSTVEALGPAALSAQGRVDFLSPDEAGAGQHPVSGHA